MRKGYMIAIALILLGVAPLLAASKPTVISIPRVVPAIGGESAGAIATQISVAQVDPNFSGFVNGVPCFNCVPTSGIVNLGVGLPLTWVTHSSSMAFVLIVDVYSYSGVANFIYSIREGERSQTGKVVARGNVLASVYPASWAAYFPGTIPATPGRYTLVGEFDAGGAVSAVTAPLIIQ